MRHAFPMALDLRAFNGMKIDEPEDDATAATLASTLSTQSSTRGMSVGGGESLATLRNKLRTAKSKAKKVPGGGKEPNLPQDNPTYQMPLFLEFEKRKNGGKAIRCRQDVQAVEPANLRAKHMIGEKTAASYKDTQDILKITVNPPLNNELLPNLKTMEVHALVALPEG